MTKLLVILFLFVAVACVRSAEIPAATGSRADVIAARDLASPGDTVVIPGGTFSWSGDIAITGITLQGPGKDHGTPLNITAGKVVMTKHATAYVKVLGIRFTGSAQKFVAGGAGAKMFVIGDCYFNVPNSTLSLGQITANGGLIYDCDFVCPTVVTVGGADVLTINTSAAGRWLSGGSFMGNADTTGENNVYFEGNYWEGITEVSFDADNGSRIVARHNIFQDSGFVGHGGGDGNDTSSWGVQSIEIYDNEFRRVNGSIAVNRWGKWRGGSGVIVSNVIDSCHSGEYPFKPEFEFTIGCPEAYPQSYQIGQTIDPPENPPSHGILIFGNTGTGVDDPNFIDKGENPNNACADPEAYIVEGRDYHLSNEWNWVPYQYPHPLNPASGTPTTVGNAVGYSARVGSIRAP